MKKYFLILILGGMMACNGNGQQAGTNGETNGGIAQEPAQTDAMAQGRQLIQNSDCRACHMDDTRVIGPSYQEIAERYEATDENINLLAGKIIEGGSGNWGEVPMTPHPQHSQEEARQMAKYILSLNQD